MSLWWRRRAVLVERDVVDPEVEDRARIEIEIDGVDRARIGAHLRLLQPEVALAEPGERDPELGPGRPQRQIDAGGVVAGGASGGGVRIADPPLGTGVLVADRQPDLVGRGVADAGPEGDAGPDVGVVGEGGV